MLSFVCLFFFVSFTFRLRLGSEFTISARIRCHRLDRSEMGGNDWRRICAVHELIGSYVPLASYPLRNVVGWHHFPITEMHPPEDKDTAFRHNDIWIDSRRNGIDV